MQKRKAILVADLAKAVSKCEDMHKVCVTIIVDAMLKVMREALLNGEDVKITHFGTLYLKDQRKYGHNFQTGKQIYEDSYKKVIKFIPCKKMKEKVNKGVCNGKNRCI